MWFFVSFYFLSSFYILFSLSFSQFGFLSTQDISPINKSLGGGSIALFSGLDSVMVNPAQLSASEQSNAYVSFFNGFSNDRYLGALGSHKFSDKQVPVSFGFEMSLPEYFEELDSHGGILDQHTYYELITTIISGYKFNNIKQPVYLGGTIKYHYVNALYQQAHNVLFDFGIILPFYIKALRFKKANKKYNFLLGISLQNFGPYFKINDTYLAPPSSIQFGFAYIIFQNKNHHILITVSNKFFIPYTQQEIFNEIGFGMEYAWLKFVALRFGFVHNLNTWEIRSGIGLYYTHQQLYKIQIDFNLDFIPNLGLSEHISLTISVLSLSAKNKFSKRLQEQKQIELRSHEELLTILNEGIRFYKLKYNKYPITLEELNPWLLETYQLVKLPSHIKRKIVYDAYTGNIKINSSIALYQDKILMKDGLEYHGEIKKMTNKIVVLETSNGVFNYPRENIQSIVNLKLKALDKENLIIMQDYLHKYKLEKNEYPTNELLFLIYLKKYDIQGYPKLNYGELKYDSIHQKIMIECNLKVCSSE